MEIFYIIWRFHTFVKFEILYKVAFPRPSCEAILYNYNHITLNKFYNKLS